MRQCQRKELQPQHLRSFQIVCKYDVSKKNHNINIYGVSELFVSPRIILVQNKFIGKTLQSCTLPRSQFSFSRPNDAGLVHRHESRVISPFLYSDP